MSQPVEIEYSENLNLEEINKCFLFCKNMRHNVFVPYLYHKKSMIIINLRIFDFLIILKLVIDHINGGAVIFISKRAGFYTVKRLITKFTIYLSMKYIRIGILVTNIVVTSSVICSICY